MADEKTSRRDWLKQMGNGFKVAIPAYLALKAGPVFASPNGDIYISDEAPDAVVAPNLQNLPNKDWGWGNRYDAQLTDPSDEPFTLITSLPTDVSADAVNKELDSTHYKVYTVYSTGSVQDSSTVHLDFDATPVGIAERELKPALENVINAPNPFLHSTRLDYSLMNNHHVNVTVHDIKGGLVKKLYEGAQLKGDHTLEWDGTNAYGSSVSPGLYLMNIMIPGLQQKTLKVVKQ